MADGFVPYSKEMLAEVLVHLKLPFEMFLSDSKAQLRANGDSLPLASYFSFPKAGDSETTLLPPQKRLKDDTSYWGGFLQDMPVGDDTLSMFTHPRAIQKPRKREIPRKTRRTPKNTLVLELEGTSAISSLTTHWVDGSTFITRFQDKSYQVSIKLRPHIHEFLEVLAKIYEVFVFTTAKQDYTDKILEALGPHRKLIRQQLTQEDCLCHHGSYIKDLSVLERDLERTVAVATYLQAFPYQTANVLAVPRWTGDPQDKELLHLIPVLEKLSQAADIRAEIALKHHGKKMAGILFQNE